MKPDWRKKEVKDRRDFEGQLQKASGALWDAPSDVVSELFSIDSKTTVNNSYSISLKTWNKLCEEAAWNKEKIPLLSIQINGTELVVLSKEDFLQLIAKEDRAR